MEGSGPCYHTLEAWARGSGFSVWVLTLQILNIYTRCAPGLGGWVVSKPSLLSLQPPLPTQLRGPPSPSGLLRCCGLAADLTEVSVWVVRGESGVEAVRGSCLSTPGLDVDLGWGSPASCLALGLPEKAATRTRQREDPGQCLGAPA